MIWGDNMFDSFDETVRNAKKDPHCKVMNGFCVANIDGKFDYFPFGQPSHKVTDDNRVVRTGIILSLFFYNKGKWWESD